MSPKTNFKAVAFDMDGLMFNTEDVYWKAASALLGKRGHEYTPELCATVMGRTPQFCFELFKERFDYPETWQELQNESEDLFLEYLKDGYDMMPGLPVILNLLESRHIPKGVCTSSACRVVREVLRKDDVVKRFQFILTAEDIINGKPHPEIYQKAIQKFRVAPQEMLVLEDSVAGCRSARAAGAFCVAVRAEHNQEADFDAAHLVVNSLDASGLLALFDHYQTE